ncbi:hypothetical protein [Lignipirellula cremea]|uniref:Uncharacterized protein n=1 Tax=Lignipirellula cremea TaxID=2528010 RepID=A0A518DZ76_9BACT|nr:hypothetical protein [Lignipirellula cremea]QDU97150.1 hypothetical protein Pla8534_49950 [Lignipirellula cremea]
MPIRFPCEHCNRVLKVSSSKIGRPGKCPNCTGPITVPDADTATELMEQRTAAAPPREPEDPEEEEFDPFAEFVVYDNDHDEDFYIQPGKKVAADTRPLDPTRLAVPRSVIYLQGVLLAVTAALFFAVGFVVGGFAPTGPPTEDTIEGPFFVSGEVRYQSSNRSTANDYDAVVVVLPSDAQPEQKVVVEGLRPTDNSDLDRSDQLRSLQQVGGVYARVDTSGHYQVRVLSPGKYLVLVISRNTWRSDTEPLLSADANMLNRYFDSAWQLIGDRRYRLAEQTIRRDQKLNVLFKPGV